MVKKTLKLPVVQKIAKKLKITPAQVMISWHVQRGTVVLPKSADPGRVSENYQCTFSLLDSSSTLFFSFWFRSILISTHLSLSIHHPC